ncbi:MAG: HlyD family efflux transporter periplasmic adaptor subunit [Candidatus Pacebacteria bacterium]|nr:HlyD family efflux transporter periplasmic adaptor subunit [Candidatus Paceibacterota bacterium]
MKKTIIYILIGLIIVITFITLINRNSKDQKLYEVKAGNIIKEVLETGAVSKGEPLYLSFLTGGTIKTIDVSEGELVKKGQILASLDKSDLLIQKNQAQERLSIALTELELLKPGTKEQDIQTTQNKVNNALESLRLAEQSLEQTELSAELSLNQTYSSVFSLINESYILAKSIYNDLEQIRDDYFSDFYFSETQQARTSIGQIFNDYEKIKDLVTISSISSNKEKDQSLLITEQSFSNIEKEIENIINISESDYYKYRFSTADKNVLWNDKTQANTMLFQITSLINNINSVKEQNKANITLAKSQKVTAQANYDTILDSLKRLQTGGISLELEAAQAKVESARQDINLLEQQIERAVLIASSEARVSVINFRQGERVSPYSPVLVLIPEQDFQIKADIYEGDIVKIQIGNPVKVEFIAFPKQEFKGQIVSVNPIGKLKDNIVYYEIIVSLEEIPDNLMVEMTADLIIQAEQKENVLIIPQQGVIKEAGKTFVKVLEKNTVTEKEIKTGITDFLGNIEVIEGLKLGEIIVLD